VAKPITAVQLKDYLHKADCATGTEKQSVDHLVSVKMLARYIEQGNVCAYFQPQYSISRSQIVGFEALARLQVNGRIIPPNQFISVAEQHCLIAPLTKAVIHVSLASFSKLEATHKSMTLSLNISSKVLEDEDFPYWLSAAAAQYGIDNQLIVCELTESHTSKEPAVVHVSLLRLRMLRFLLSIDDFGTGYASLTQLHALPFDELKIDRCFVMDLLTNEKSQAMCSRSLSLAKDLGLKSVAEGIEDQETLDFLQMLGCNIAQGFFLARPEPSDNAIERVNNNQIGLWEPLGDPVLSS
jgi:EAL domain-containing protein (putative c-di-GMP-specific phosphodiesterase class I)